MPRRLPAADGHFLLVQQSPSCFNNVLSVRFTYAFKVALATTLAFAISIAADWDEPHWAAFAVAFCSLATGGESLLRAPYASSELFGRRYCADANRAIPAGPLAVPITGQRLDRLLYMEDDGHITLVLLVCSRLYGPLAVDAALSHKNVSVVEGLRLPSFKRPLSWHPTCP